MTTLEKIIEDLSVMDEQQLAKVSEFIQVFRVQEMPVKCDRQNILKFIEQARQRHPQRSIEEIDRELRAERDAWDS